MCVYLLVLSSYPIISLHGYELFKNMQNVIFILSPSTASLSDRRFASVGTSRESSRAQRHYKMVRL